MKSTGKVWLFFDQKLNTQSRPMNTAQAQATLLSLVHNNLNRYFIWTPGWNEWQSLSAFIHSDQSYFVTNYPPRPSNDPFTHIEDDEIDNISITVRSQTQTDPSDHTIPSTDPSYTKINPTEAGEETYGFYSRDFSGDDLTYRKLNKNASKNKTLKNMQEKRSSPRQELKIEVILINKTGRSFRSYSKNISLAGTLIDLPAPPEFLNAKLDVVIINKFEKDTKKSRLALHGKIVGDQSDPRRIMFQDMNENSNIRLAELLDAYIRHQKSKPKKSA